MAVAVRTLVPAGACWVIVAACGAGGNHCTVCFRWSAVCLLVNMCSVRSGGQATQLRLYQQTEATVLEVDLSELRADATLCDLMNRGDCLSRMGGTDHTAHEDPRGPLRPPT